MIPWFQFSVMHLGPIPIQVWGLFVAAGMMLSLVILARLHAGKARQEILDQALWMIVGGVIFARVFHVLLYEPQFFLQNPLEIIKIWHGGLSSFGGLTGAILGYALFMRHRKLGGIFWQRADVISFAAIFGWMLGRVGCFMIHDHLGRSCPGCFLAIQTPNGPRLEMALIEIIGLIPLGVIFILARKRPRIAGWYTGVLFVYYGTLRFILDFFRATDIPSADIRYLGLTPGQYFAILLVLMGAYLHKKQKEQAGRIA